MDGIVPENLTEFLEKWQDPEVGNFSQPFRTSGSGFLARCKALWVQSLGCPGDGPTASTTLINTLAPAVWDKLADLVKHADPTVGAHRLAVPNEPSSFLLVWPLRGTLPPQVLAAVLENDWLKEDAEDGWRDWYEDDSAMPAAEILTMLLLELEWQQKEKLLQAEKHVEQLLNERITLKTSHAEAVASVVAEREQRLREQEEHYHQIQTIMRKAADAIVTLNESGTIQSINEAAEEIFGFRENELVGQPVDVLLGCDHREASSLEVLCQALKSERQVCEIQGQRKDGTAIELELSVSEVSLGQERRYIVIFRDITIRKRLEEQQRRLHLMNQMILNAAGDGIVGVDHEGRITFVNPAASRMLGWECDELLGRSFRETVHQPVAQAGNHGMRDFFPVKGLPHSATPALTQTVFRRRDGSTFPVECSSQPIREDERITGQVITFRDISERQMLEAKLRQAQKMESIGQLAAGIAHEINTPTQYIGDNICFVLEAWKELDPIFQGCLEIRRRLLSEEAIQEEHLAALYDAIREVDLDYLYEDVPRALNEAMEGVRGVAKIVRSMKEFSHPAAQAKQVVDFNRCVESTVTVCRNEWKYVADVELDLDPQLPPVYCSPGEMNQVLLNLIVNAAHAIGDKLGGVTNERGKITISTRCQGDWLEIRVSDTGTGIPEAIRDRIFDPFFTTKPVGKGTGQGLAITHSIVVEKHHGTIDVETTPGKGTTFIVRIPIHDQEEEKNASDLPGGSPEPVIA
ncbi:MAG: PAS domain S-box protein [Thermogutta sp.]|jgi:PAS domain S-box-containing protein